MTNRHSALVSLGLAVAAALVANLVVVRLLHVHFNLGAEIGFEVLVFIIGGLLPLSLVLVIFRHELKAILDIVAKGPGKAAPILLGFVREELKSLEGQIEKTRRKGVNLENDTVTSWVRQRCFAVSSGPYRTTDPLVPSEFLATYPSYLNTHANYVKQTSCTRSVRVNIAPVDQLARDSRENPVAWRKYVRWHAENKVQLLHLNRADAAEIARQNEMKTTIDVATWEGTMALLVEYPLVGQTKLRLVLIGEDFYAHSMSFIEAIQEQAIPFAELDLDISTNPRIGA